MRAWLWVARIVLFLLLFAFAIKNTDPVGVRFFLDTAWHAPLIIVVLAFFAGGVAVAVLSLLGTLFGLRREIARLQRALQAAERRDEQPATPPADRPKRGDGTDD